MDIIYEKPTHHSFDDAIERVTAELKARNFGVLWQLNMENKLAEHGFDLGAKAVILEVCNPKQAHTVLTQELSVGYFLPCKVAIFEKDNQVTIGTVKPSILMGMMPGLDLSEVANEVEQVLQDSVDAAAQG